MKKLVALIFISLVLSISGPAFSQEKFPVKLGLKVSPNIGWMNPGTKGYSKDGALMGATIGFVSDFYFAENYAFSSGFNFQYLNGKLNYTDSLLMENNSKVVNGEVYRKYHFLYIEIPMMIKMRTKPFGKTSFFGQIGLGTGFRIKSSVKEHFVPDTGEPVDQQYDFNRGTSVIRESILIGAGCEYNLDESSRIMVSLGYSNSLNNVLTGTNYKSGLDEKSTLNYIELNIGFLF